MAALVTLCTEVLMQLPSLLPASQLWQDQPSGFLAGTLHWIRQLLLSSNLPAFQSPSLILPTQHCKSCDDCDSCREWHFTLRQGSDVEEALAGSVAKGKTDHLLAMPSCHKSSAAERCRTQLSPGQKLNPRKDKLGLPANWPPSSWKLGPQ